MINLFQSKRAFSLPTDEQLSYFYFDTFRVSKNIVKISLSEKLLILTIVSYEALQAP